MVAGDVYHEGIGSITQTDIAFADRLGYIIKLLAIAEAELGPLAKQIEDLLKEEYFQEAFEKHQNAYELFSKVPESSVALCCLALKEYVDNVPILWLFERTDCYMHRR